MRVLFWNTQQNKEINQMLKELILENNVSIAVLAEYEDNPNNLIFSLSEHGVVMHLCVTVGCDRLLILSSIDGVEPSIQSAYSSIQIVNKKDILCCVHLPSQIYSQSRGRREIAISQIVSDICALEDKLNTENVIVVGDFNINPFDSGLVHANLFHGLPVYKEASRKSRTIDKQEFRMFYNPMWNFLGDFREPYGTYYYGGSDIDNTYWHLYDQVIIRPALRERFLDSSLKIVTEVQSKSLLDGKGHPNKKISDHLPIVFEIQEDSHG